ncbi:MAG TPA: hypothetical protein VFH83_14310 [Spirochaetia bacterium]|nr:hypothetical protein [Spirochaetia bacterium]
MTPGDGVIELFYPRRLASWWTVLEDILYPEKRIRDKILRRAEGLAEARIDSVVQFGFHTRFDFIPYFGALHAYHAAVAEELHRFGIRFIEHFSCNVIARPRDAADRERYHRAQRHHVALYPDLVARPTLAYEGYRVDSLRSVTVTTGLPSYAAQYQCELLCHANPDFRAMTQAYLRRYLSEVPVDGIEVDDMAIYDGFLSCGCQHCRERFRRETGLELPPVDDRRFWGDTSRSPLLWGNYDNPDFRAWVQMRLAATSEHFGLIRQTVGSHLRLTTCSSNTGPILMNAFGMRYESLAAQVNLILLENNGIDVSAADWPRTEPEAMLQKSYAQSRGGLPVVALSYANCADGAYLGWAIARFWGVSNWTSTLVQGLAEDPPGLLESSQYVAAFNRWDLENGDLDVREIAPATEVYLAYSRHGKENGLRLPDGRDVWERISQWSRALLARNVSYQFIREDTLGDAMERLEAPVILESCACLSDRQADGIIEHARRGGRLILRGPLGTRDENGRDRERRVMEELMALGPPPGVTVVGSGEPGELVDGLIHQGRIRPAIRASDPSSGYVARLHAYAGRAVLHLLNTLLEGVPDPRTTDEWATANAMLSGIRSLDPTPRLVLEIDFSLLGCAVWRNPRLRSPEVTGDLPLGFRRLDAGRCRLDVDLSRLRLYAMVAEA